MTIDEGQRATEASLWELIGYVETIVPAPGVVGAVGIGALALRRR